MGALAILGEDKVKVRAHERQRAGFAQAAPADVTQAVAPTPPQPVGRGPLGLLPAAGGFVGSLGGGALGALGGPAAPIAIPAGRIAGAAAGGGLGELAAQALAGEPISGPEIGRQALLQGGFQGVGEAAAGLAPLAGKALMANALKVSGALRQRFPQLDFAGTAIGERLPVGRMFFRPGSRLKFEGGAGRAQQLVKESAQAEKTLRSAAGNQGMLFDVRQSLVQPRIDEVNEMRYAANRPALQPQEEARIARQVQNTVKQAISDRTGGAVSHPAVQLTPEELHWVEQYAQKNARKTFVNAITGQTEASTDQSMAAIARNARQTLVTPGLIPGLPEQSARTQALRGLNQAVRNREFGVPGQNVFERAGERVASYGTLGLLGGAYGATRGESAEQRILGGLIGAGGGALLGSPQAMSLIGLGVSDPYLLQLLRQAPRAVGALAQ